MTAKSALSEHQGFYMHRRPTTSHRGGVTAYFVMKQMGKREYTVEYTLALCNPIDTFNKRFGRTIAKGRFDKNVNVHCFPILADDPKEMRDIAIKRMDSLCRFELNELWHRHDVKIQRAVRHFESELRRGRIDL